MLPVAASTVDYLARLLAGERARRGTRRGQRALEVSAQAVVVLRWFLDATRVTRLARDSGISRATAYRYLHEGIDVLTAAAPGLHGALLVARAAGYSRVHLDGSLITTIRSRALGPTPGVDLWWSGKHRCHGGNIQVITAPDGWPLWSSPVRPGREHDLTCARAHPGLLDGLAEFIDDDHAVLADLGYEGESDRLTVPIKTRSGAGLCPDQRTVNVLHSATRAIAERGNALLKNTFRALRHLSLCPQRIGAITAAALVLLHTEHNRTT
ncbi:transposase family protein [Pseudonocardia sp. ICBG1142]|uniref:transposase family protein n=1 Tax=Pseudonocardia sp. ICBG1142 TaxID=2846760 RepID=UPI001CF630C6|nr:transposase family protein [Pseudonocardia sp. ICBG1142]